MTHPHPMAESLAWAGDGAAHLRGLMTRMGDDAFGAPSALPGWTRAHVLTHVARNADAMINLLTWASTGVETPGYPSDQARADAIEAGAARPPAEIRDDVLASFARVAAAVAAMPKQAWSAHVVTRHGRRVPASDIPWMRAVEMWIHAVDLDVGASFADFPPPMLPALLAEVTAAMGVKEGCPALRLVAPDGAWTVGDGDAEGVVTVTGPAPELAAWLLGRSRGKELRADGTRRLPALPRWL